MFVHLTMHFVYFINKSGEEDPENSPLVVFASPFSFCLCGIFVCVVCGIFFLLSIHLSFLNVLCFWKPSKERYIYFCQWGMRRQVEPKAMSWAGWCFVHVMAFAYFLLPMLPCPDLSPAERWPAARERGGKMSHCGARCYQVWVGH